MQFYYLCSDSLNPYYNQALENHLLINMKEGNGILFLWQNENTVVIGRNQNVYKEVNVERFLQDGGKIARRKSGGGAVYHDVGNLNFSILCHGNDREQCRYTEIVRNVLWEMGIPSSYNGRNDILVKGKKVSGNACFLEGLCFCQHGTILVDADLGKMPVYLTPDKEKMDRNYIKSVSQRVGNLSDRKKDISVQTVKQAFIKSLSSIPLSNKIDYNIVEGYKKAYQSEKWIFGGKQ